MSQHIVITGANRGIGLGFVNHYLKQGMRVTACCRAPQHADALQRLSQQYPQLSLVRLDITVKAEMNAFIDSLVGEPIDLLINNAGDYGPKGVTFGHCDEQEWLKVMQVNAIAPIMLTQACYPLLKQSRQSKVIFISSKMGSIADNNSGGAYLYRSSKAALNAAVKSLAIDLHVDGIACAVYHPGWVQTAMGGPNALISVKDSVAGLSHCIDTLVLTGSGGFYNYDGNPLPW